MQGNIGMTTVTRKMTKKWLKHKQKWSLKAPRKIL